MGHSGQTGAIVLQVAEHFSLGIEYRFARDLLRRNLFLVFLLLRLLDCHVWDILAGAYGLLQ